MTSQSTFSYAQAAKGQSTPQSTSQDAAASHSNGENTSTAPLIEHKEDSQIAEHTATRQSWADIELASAKSQEQVDNAASSTGNVEEDPKTSSHIGHLNDKSTDVEPSTVSDNTVKNDTVTVPIHISEQDVGNVSSAKTSDADSTNTMAGDDSSKSSAVEDFRPQMVDAPVPSVNVWEQRTAAKAQQQKAGRFAKPATKQERGATVISTEAVSKRPANKGTTNGSQNESTQTPRYSKAGQSKSVPPPATDATFWPTPDVTKIEGKKDEKKTPVEQADVEKQASKHHAKDKWEKIDFVPTAVFHTPLPARGGGRGGRGGGRGGGRDHATRGGSTAANGTDRSSITNGNGSQAQTAPRDTTAKSRDTSASRPVTKSKRSTQSSPVPTPAGATGESTREKRDSLPGRQYSNPRPNGGRKQSNGMQAEGATTNIMNGVSDAPKQSTNAVEFTEPKYHRTERSYQMRNREPASEQNGYVPSRERGEGRPERGGRGSWRGKANSGNHSTFNSGSHYQTATSYHGSKSFTEQRHNLSPAPFGSARDAKHNRANSRSQSIPNGVYYGRYPPAGIPGPNGLPAIHTDIANSFVHSQPPAPASAIPFTPYAEHVQTPHVLQLQLEYYFSPENLVKDIYLRSHMDGQGFVFLDVLAQFRRIQALTQDANLLRFACGRSEALEFYTGADGIDRVRSSKDWGSWVLPFDQRVPAAQNDGPTHLQTPQFETLPPMYGNYMHMYPGMSHSVPMTPVGGAVMVNGFHPGPALLDMNTVHNQYTAPQIVQTPLSAAAHDFQPGQPILQNHSRFQNQQEPEEDVTDPTIAQLKIAVQPKKKDIEQEGNLANGHGESGKIVASGADMGESQVNGTAQTHSKLQEFANDLGAPQNRPMKSDRHRIAWAYSGDAFGLSYDDFRSRAFDERIEAPSKVSPDAMNDLYEFWNLFLTKHFNARMYAEFHSTAIDDANKRQSLTGMKSLADFYGKSLYGGKLVADRLLRDFVNFVEFEFRSTQAPERPMFSKLRQIWRDGATNFGNRSNLGKKLSEDIKSALDQPGPISCS